ncbi:MAG: helix-turn-helix transcriptional regulator, partial [Nitrospirota bacterium]
MRTKTINVHKDIKQVRSSLGLTLKEFSSLLGITISALSKYEADGKNWRVMPTADMYLKIMSYKRGD